MPRDKPRDKLRREFPTPSPEILALARQRAAEAIEADRLKVDAAVAAMPPEVQKARKQAQEALDAKIAEHDRLGAEEAAEADVRLVRALRVKSALDGLSGTQHVVDNDAEEDRRAQRTGKPRTRRMNPELDEYRDHAKAILRGDRDDDLPPKPEHWVRD